MKLKKMDGETREQFIFRCYNDKTVLGMTNKEIAEEINSELGTNYQESYLRGIYTNYTIGYNDGFEKALTDNDEHDELKLLEDKRLELEKEKIRFQDQKREYRNYLRADARFEHLKNTMVDEILKINKTKPLTTTPIVEFKNGKEASLILSDLHIGLEVTNRFNEFSVEIARERMETLTTKVIEYCILHEINVLHVELCGDLVNGYIHLGTRVSNEEDVISQTMIVSEMLSDMMAELGKYIPNVKVYSTIGNHGRCTANIKESIAIENFERLIPWYMKPRLADCTNVEIVEQSTIEDDIVIYNVFNETIFSIHGHNDKVGSVINDLSKMLKIFPSEVHMGHYHHRTLIEDNDMEVIVNGCFSGTDQYAVSIRKSNKPSQTLIIYNGDGQECIYKIKL